MEQTLEKLMKIRDDLFNQYVVISHDMTVGTDIEKALNLFQKIKEINNQIISFCQKNKIDVPESVSIDLLKVSHGVSDSQYREAKKYLEDNKVPLYASNLEESAEPEEQVITKEELEKNIGSTAGEELKPNGTLDSRIHGIITDINVNLSYLIDTKDFWVFLNNPVEGFNKTYSHEYLKGLFSDEAKNADIIKDVKADIKAGIVDRCLNVYGTGKRSDIPAVYKQIFRACCNFTRPEEIVMLVTNGYLPSSYLKNNNSVINYKDYLQMAKSVGIELYDPFMKKEKSKIIDEPVIEEPKAAEPVKDEEKADEPKVAEPVKDEEKIDESADMSKKKITKVSNKVQETVNALKYIDEIMTLTTEIAGSTSEVEFDSTFGIIIEKDPKALTYYKNAADKDKAQENISRIKLDYMNLLGYLEKHKVLSPTNRTRITKVDLTDAYNSLSKIKNAVENRLEQQTKDKNGILKKGASLLGSIAATYGISMMPMGLTAATVGVATIIDHNLKKNISEEKEQSEKWKNVASKACQTVKRVGINGIVAKLAWPLGVAVSAGSLVAFGASSVYLKNLDPEKVVSYEDSKVSKNDLKDASFKEKITAIKGNISNYLHDPSKIAKFKNEVLNLAISSGIVMGMKTIQAIRLAGFANIPFNEALAENGLIHSDGYGFSR